MLRVEAQPELTLCPDGGEGCRAAGAEMVRLGNRLVGNHEGAGALQLLDGKARIEFGAPRYAAVMGMGFKADVNGLGVPAECLFLVRAEGVLHLEALKGGGPRIAYLCVSGGVSGPAEEPGMLALGDEFNPPELGTRLPQGLSRQPRSPLLLRLVQGDAPQPETAALASEDFEVRGGSEGVYALKGSHGSALELDAVRGEARAEGLRLDVAEIDWGSLVHLERGVPVKLRLVDWKRAQRLAAQRQQMLRSAPLQRPAGVSRTVRVDGEPLEVEFGPLRQGQAVGFSHVRLARGREARVHIEEVGGAD